MARFLIAVLRTKTRLKSYRLVGCSGIVLGFSIDKLDIGFDPGDAEDIEYCFEE